MKYIKSINHETNSKSTPYNYRNLTVVTPVSNAGKFIFRLIKSLNGQSDKNFTWIIIDGMSTDNTLEIIKDKCEIDFRIISKEDFSIYHALNNALKIVDTSYYCVAGADDTFETDFISEANIILNNKRLDLVFGSVRMEKKIVKPGFNKGWLKGMHGVGSSHSVGTIIKKDLHEIYGVYSKNFPIVADQFFIKKCIKGSVCVCRTDRLFGTYSLNGFSASNKLGYQLDYFKMQIESGENFVIQFIIFIARLIKLKLISS